MIIHVQCRCINLVYILFLTEKVKDDPLTVKLNFEPGGRPESEDDYYLQHKENICVVCGSEEMLIKKQVVPKEYRRCSFTL